VLGDFYEVMTDLDEQCGVCFNELGISIDTADPMP